MSGVSLGFVCRGLFQEWEFPVFRRGFQYVVDGSALEALSQQTAAFMFFASQSVTIESELSA